MVEEAVEGSVWSSSSLLMVEFWARAEAEEFFDDGESVFLLVLLDGVESMDDAEVSSTMGSLDDPVFSTLGLVLRQLSAPLRSRGLLVAGTGSGNLTVVGMLAELVDWPLLPAMVVGVSGPAMTWKSILLGTNLGMALALATAGHGPARRVCGVVRPCSVVVWRCGVPWGVVVV